MAYVYRDSETGHFVSESTYNRSTAHGGDRYEREDAYWLETPEPDEFESLDELEEYLEEYGWDDFDAWDWVEYESSADYEE